MTVTLVDDERQLVTFRTIDRLDPIPGADRIETAVIDGWQTIVKKGEHEVGDPVVYFEVDSMLPILDPRFSFLADRGVRDVDGVLYHRLRTMRMRGVTSQGLVIPLSALTDAERRRPDLLGVIKYEPPVATWGFNQGDAGGPFPTHLAEKTDSERAQNLAKCWDRLARHVWYPTEKLDGTSLTVARDHQGTLIVASRNLQRLDGDNEYWNAVRKFDLDRVEVGEALQAEIFGPGIQGNPLHLKEQRIAIFKYWRNRQTLKRWHWPLWIPPDHSMVAPLLMLAFPSSVADAVEQVNGLRSTINPDALAEGIVWHKFDEVPVAELDYRTNFKVLNNEYLMGNDD